MPILYKGITAILAVIGCMSLLLTGEVNLLLCLSALALFPGYYRLFRGRPQASKRAAAILAQTALLLFAADALFISRDMFLAVAHMTITFQGIKSFDLKEPWDHLQVYFMSLLQLIIASELTRALMFGVIFVLFMILLVTAMIFSHFIKEGALGRVRLRKPVVAIVLLTLLGTIFFFVAIPRTPQRFIGRGHYRGIKTVGFSERVDFGSFGEIKLDQTVVMRIEMNREVPRPYYWRGAAMDYFDGRSWRNTTRQRGRIGKQGSEFVLSRYDGNRALAQEVFLEPIDSDAIFGLAEIVAVNAETLTLATDDDQGLFMPGRFPRRVRYTVFSDLRGSSTGRAEPKYLQVPAGMSRVRSLAEEITASAETAEKKALMIESYLIRNFAYSLITSPPPAGMDVIGDFLFNTRKGYCEHYAASMVMMLRSIGIPSRIVNGFYGGERNEYGNYLIVRQSDAHAWVEALIGDKWRRFDPTPAVLQRHPSAIALLLDSVRLQWTRYVIGFSFYDQREILKKMTLPFRLGDLKGLRPPAIPATGFIIVSVAAMLLFVIFAARWRDSRRYGFVTAAYLDFRKLLKKSGLPLTDSMSSGDIRTMLRDKKFGGEAEEFLALYEKHRFGGRVMDIQATSRYKELLGRIKKHGQANSK
jgi:transglutaminase-like putative cysteine protease